MKSFDREYWNDRYRQEATGWDIGYPSTPIKTYADQLIDFNLKILIPGAGNAYEVEYLYKKGFKNIFLLDISNEAVKKFIRRCPEFPEDQVLCMDFFDHSAKYDLIIEQTFFCALHPSQRPAYAKKMSELLKTGGRLVGLLFNFPLSNQGPPFGGSEKEYRSLFSPHFDIEILEPCYNSIKPRLGSEFFLKMRKP